MALPAVFNILYIGDDEKYFSSLQNRFVQEYTDLSFTFKTNFATTPSGIQSLILKVRQSDAHIVILDFSKFDREVLHLARILIRISLNKNLTIIGLVDYRQEANLHREATITGIPVVHIKSAEIHNVIYDTMAIAAPTKLKRHEFMTAEFADEPFHAWTLCRLGYVTKDKLHIESNYKFSIGQKVQLNSFLKITKFLPSNWFTISEHSTNNLYYNFNYSLTINPDFVDQPKVTDKMNERDILEKKLEYKDNLEYAEIKLEKWVKKNIERSRPKNVKMMIIDKEYVFYNDQIRADKHPYVIRSKHNVKNILKDLDHIHPHIIAINMEAGEDVPEELEHENQIFFNDLKSLKVLAKKVSEVKDCAPYLIVFNSHLSNQELQEAIGYKNVIGMGQDLGVEVLLKICQTLHDKLTDQANKKHTTPRIVFDKETTESICELQLDISLVALSETDMYFKSSHQFEAFTSFKISFPVEMYITIIPAPFDSKYSDCYYALVHMITEEGKKELRQFINSVFFREHDEKKQDEVDEFMKLNEEVAKKRQEEKDKASQDAAKKVEDESNDT